MAVERSFDGNRLLDALGAEDSERIAGHLEEVRFEPRQFPYNERIDSVYFPLDSVVSLLAQLKGDPGVEIATIGREGLVGLSCSWGEAQLNSSEVLQVQVPGMALRMDAEIFGAEFARNEGLADVVRRYTQGFVSQLSQQVVCSGLHSIEERCARWLLSVHDQVGSDEFSLTQEHLSQMLGVRRASVTVVAGALQQAGLIRYHRGRVSILDNEGLERASCECYGVLREVFVRLFP